MTLAPVDTAAPYRLATGDGDPQVQAILGAAGLLGPQKRIAYLGLLDPARGSAGEDRRFRIFIHDVSGAAPTDVVVSVTRGTWCPPSNWIPR